MNLPSPYSNPLPILVILAACLASSRGLAAEAVDSCVDCHQDQSFRVKNKKLFDYFKQWKGSAHDEAGVSCDDCHGGDPDALGKEEAHTGILAPSDQKSPVFYKNIPKSCGECHFEVYEYFIQSKHFQQLMNEDEGPNCVTCHGSLNSATYFSSDVVKTCADCHNSQSQNHPEVIELAGRILHRMNVAGTYRKWTSLHYESEGKPQVMKNANSLYDEIARSWHQFDFEETDRESETLLLELRSLYNSARRDVREKRSRLRIPAEYSGNE